MYREEIIKILESKKIEDYNLNLTTIKIIESIIPCLEQNYRKSFLIFIKLIEIDSLFKIYKCRAKNNQCLIKKIISYSNINKIKPKGDIIDNNLSENQLKFLNSFLRDTKGKSLLEIANVIREYKEKASKDLTDVERSTIVQYLFNNLSPDEKEKFISMRDKLS
jgi:hypothetical protein